MRFSRDFFHHLQAVQAAARRHGLQACMRLDDFSLQLEGEDRSACWRPKFLAGYEHGLRCTDAIGAGTVGFAGWLPPLPAAWPIAADRRAFRTFAAAQGLPAPDAGAPFLQGHTARAWCFGATPIVLELEPPVTVTGDGRSRLRDLVAALPDCLCSAHDWDRIAGLARRMDVASVDAVVPAGQELMVEYRHDARYRPPAPHNRNVLAQAGPTAIGRQLARACAALAPAIAQEPAGRQRLYTLDAVLDGAGRLWFLRMNCDPAVHPDAYGRMVAHAATVRPAPADAADSHTTAALPWA